MLFGKKIVSECHKLSQGPEAINLPASLTFFSLSSFWYISLVISHQRTKNKEAFDLLKICQCERKSELGLTENILQVTPLLHHNIHYFILFC